MAVKKMPYKDLNHSLRCLRGQVMDGIPYAQENIPPLNSPEKIFMWLKLRTKYKNDPKGTELFQTLPTLLDDNFHGRTGYGDCDCFTIAALTILLANGFTDCGIVLVGRNRSNAVHIYAWVVDDTGERKILDLTNRVYNYERTYPFKQFIKFNLTPKEKETMTLQLADNSGLPGYVWMPSQGVHLREDMFDHLSGCEHQDMLLSEGYEPQEIAELAGRRRDRVNKRREARAKRKNDRNERKNKKAESKAKAREARAEGRRLRGEGKLRKGENSGGAEGEGGWKDVFGTVVGGASNVIGAFKGKQGGDDEYSDTPGYAPTDDDSIQTRVNGAPPARRGASENLTIMGMEISKPVAIAGGIGLALLVGGGIYMATKKKKAA